MSGDAAPERIAVIWAPEARAELRAIDRETAIRILHCIDLTAPAIKLKPPETGFRLRCGDYRVFFEHGNEVGIRIAGVRHRREAYR